MKNEAGQATGLGSDSLESGAVTTTATPPHHDPETARLLAEAECEQKRSERRQEAYTRRFALPVISYRLSTIRPKHVHWLWPERIARGKVTLAAGNPGLGKSQIAASITAIVTTGGHWPVDRTRCERGSVLLLSAEDDPADTIVPRLQVAGADLERVETIEAIREITEDSERQRALSLIDDLEHLEDKTHAMGDCALVIIDPISAFLGAGRIDSHNNSDVRGVMQGLQRFAERTGAAVLCVSHLSKGKQSQALMAVMGSLGFVAAARAAFGVFADDSEDGRRLFLPLKNNIGDDHTGLAFRIESATTEDGIASSRIAWEAEYISRSADEIYSDTGESDRTATDEAVEFLQQTLASGPMPVKEVKAHAREAGINEKPLRNARCRLGIKPEKTRFDGGWQWGLPAEDGPSSAPKMPLPPEGAPYDGQGTLGHRGQLGEDSRAPWTVHDAIKRAIAGRPVAVEDVLTRMSDDDVEDLAAGEMDAASLEHLVRKAEIER